MLVRDHSHESVIVHGRVGICIPGVVRVVQSIGSVLDEGSEDEAGCSGIALTAFAICVLGIRAMSGL